MLRGPYRHKEFGTVILPFTVLARFDSVLADTKEAVLEASERYEKSPSLMEESSRPVDGRVRRLARRLLIRRVVRRVCPS